MINKFRLRVAVAALLLAVNSPITYAQQQPPPQEKPKIAVIRFFAGVDAAGVGMLLQTVDTQFKMGVRQFVILISSPGGDVLSGFLAYNYLKGLPIELTTFNVGNVDSSASILYCAGTKRYAVPEARFLIHEISLSFTANGPGTMNIDLPSLEAQLALLKNQESSMAKILATTTGKSQADAESKIRAQAALSSEDAKRWGLVQDIRTELFDPANSNLVFAVPSTPNPSSTTTSPTISINPQFSYSSGIPKKN